MLTDSHTKSKKAYLVSLKDKRMKPSNTRGKAIREKKR